MPGRRRRRLTPILAGLWLALAGTPGPALGKELLLYQASRSARTQSLLEYQSYVEALPFTGIVLNIPASWATMQPGASLSYDDIYDPWLAPLQDKLNRAKRNYVLVVARRAADAFDSWAATLKNWSNLARAARDAHCAGIFFDNEAYFEKLWRYPEDVRHAHSLRAYQEKFRERGRMLMSELQRVWPEIRLIVAHGPYLSDPRTPARVTMRQASAEPDDLSGYFYAGLLEAAAPPARVVDGGEIYQYRSTEDFQQSYDWRKNGLPALAPNPLIPGRLAASWPERTRIAFGLYDLAWVKGYPMDAGILKATLEKALRRADETVWLFTEDAHDYLKPGGIGPEWLAAIRAAAGR